MNSTVAQDKGLSTAEVARRLGCSGEHVRVLARQGKLPYTPDSPGPAV